MTKPVIGLTAWMESATWCDFTGKVALLEETYLEQVTRAGGIPAVLPPYPALAEDIVGAIDGLILGGGEDVDPSLYGSETAEATTTATHPSQDSGELAIASAAINRGLPVLGICRGCQVLNVLYGGTLFQDLVGDRSRIPHALPDSTPKRESYVAHRVQARTGSVLADVLGAEFDVPSWHHQGVGRVGDGLTADAWANDGLVEAVSDGDRPFVVGVQWHPEAESGNALFAALVKAAKGE